MNYISTGQKAFVFQWIETHLNHLCVLLSFSYKLWSHEIA